MPFPTASSPTLVKATSICQLTHCSGPSGLHASSQLQPLYDVFSHSSHTAGLNPSATSPLCLNSYFALHLSDKKSLRWRFQAHSYFPPACSLHSVTFPSPGTLLPQGLFTCWSPTLGYFLYPYFLQMSTQISPSQGGLP